MPSPLPPDKPTRVTAYVTKEWAIVDFGEPGDPDYKRLESKAIDANIVSYLTSRFELPSSYKTLGPGGMEWIICGRTVPFQRRQFNTSADVIDFVMEVEETLRKIVREQFADRASKSITLPEVRSA